MLSIYLIFVIVLIITGDVSTVVNWLNDFIGWDLGGVAYFFIGWLLLLNILLLSRRS